MPWYRVYVFDNEAGLIAEPADFRAGNDIEALTKADSLRSVFGAELWESKRLVKKLPRQQPVCGPIGRSFFS
jgi:hypothetical protein